MSTQTIYVVRSDKSVLEKCTRLFLANGVEIPNVIAYSIEGGGSEFISYCGADGVLHDEPVGREPIRLKLEILDVDFVRSNAPPRTQFYSPLFPPGVEPARIGNYVVHRFGCSMFYPWDGVRWITEHGDLGPDGQPFYWRGLGFDPLTAHS